MAFIALQGSNLVKFSTAALTAGVVSNSGGTQTTLSFTATDASGGSPPYTHQWSYRLHGIGNYVNTGTNSLSTVLTGLTASTSYDVQLTYTDASSNTVSAFLLNVTTASAGALTPGSVSSGAITSTTIAVTATDASGGTPPYQYQYAIRLTGVGAYGNVPITALSGTITGLLPGTAYDIRLTYTDASLNTVTAFLLDVTTTVPVTGNYVINSTANMQWLQVGDNMPVSATFSASLIGTGALTPLTIATCTVTVYNAALEIPLTGYTDISGNVTGSPGNIVNTFVVLNCDPTIPSPPALVAGQYNVLISVADANGTEATCSVLVEVSELIG